MLTVGQAAARLGISIALIYQLCSSRKLPHIRLGCGRGTIRISESDLDAYVQAARVETFTLASTTGLKHIRPKQASSQQ